MKKITIIILFIFSSAIFGFAQNLQWTKSIGGVQQDHIWDIEIDAFENVYITGTFDSVVDFDPGAGVFNMTGVGYSPAFIAKYDSTGTFLWASQITNTGMGLFFDLQIDNSNNLYALGRFYGTIDMDPGAGYYPLTSTGEGMMLAKYDANGNLLWANGFSSSGFAVGWRLDLIGASDIVIAGRFSKTIDFDPGAGVYNVSCVDTIYENIFFARYTSSGSFVWAKAIGTQLGAVLSSMTVDASDDIYLTGFFHGDSMDIDPGASVTMLSDPIASYSSMFLVKYNSSGNLIRGNIFSGTAGDFYLWSELKTDSASNLYMTGKFTGQLDFDLGAGVYNVSGVDSLGNLYGANYGLFIAKYDAAGNLNWAKPILGQYAESASGIDIDNAGNLYIFAQTNSRYLDTDPSIGVSALTTLIGGSNMFFSKYDPSGKLFWTAALPTSGYLDAANHYSKIKVLADGDIFCSASFYNTIDLDPGAPVLNSSPVGFTDFFFSKFSQNVCSSGLIEIVSQSDLTCGINGTAVASLSGALLPYGYSWNSTPVSTTNTLSVDTIGVYTVTVTDANSCVYSRSVEIDGPTNLFNFDLEAHLISNPYFGYPGTGLVSTFDIQAFNNACQAVSGELTFILDTALTFSSATPMPTSISGDTLRWSFTGMNYYSTPLTPHIIATSTHLAWASYEFDTLQLEVYIYPYAGDVDTTNNHIDTTAVIFAFYPVGVDPPALVETDFSIYPNPFNETITIDFKTMQDNAIVDVFDIRGRKVVSSQLVSEATSMNLNLSNVDAGIYILSINVNGAVTKKKIVKN